MWASRQEASGGPKVGGPSKFALKTPPLGDGAFPSFSPAEFLSCSVSVLLPDLHSCSLSVCLCAEMQNF